MAAGSSAPELFASIIGKLHVQVLVCALVMSTDAVDQDTLALFCRCVHNTWRCGGGYHSGLSRVQHPVHHRRVWDICGAGENL